MKKLLNPLIISAIIVTMLLGSLAHLMYGSCQTSKYHYMCQAYWMPEFTPFLLSEEVNGVNWRGLDGRSRTYLDEFTLHYHMIEMPEHHTGEWSTWYENGEKETVLNFVNGELNGKAVKYNEDGTKKIEEFFKLGIGFSATFWNKDGTLKL